MSYLKEGGKVNNSEVKELAEEHWEWVESWLHIVYVDAMIHGYKHGWNDALKQPDKEE